MAVGPGIGAAPAKLGQNISSLLHGVPTGRRSRCVCEDGSLTTTRPLASRCTRVANAASISLSFLVLRRLSGRPSARGASRTSLRSCLGRRRHHGNNHGHPIAEEIGYQLRQPIVIVCWREGAALTQSSTFDPAATHHAGPRRVRESDQGNGIFRRAAGGWQAAARSRPGDHGALSACHKQILS